MITYKDKTFCSRLECDRHEINIPVSLDQSRDTGQFPIYATDGLPIVWMDFLPGCDDVRYGGRTKQELIKRGYVCA